MLTLQKPLNYDEIWIAADGFEYILESDQGELIKRHALAYERIFVPRNHKHLISSGNGELLVFELQLGDIVDSANIKFSLPGDIAASLPDRI